MNDLLIGCNAKIQRAEEGINNLDREINAFLAREPKPYRITTRHQKGGLEYAFVAYGDPTVPPRFAVLVGEIVHQLRSSLDHLLCALVIKNGGAPDKQHQFPVCTTVQKFGEARKRGQIRGVSASAERLIASVQPFTASHRSPTNTLLYGIQEQDNLDKHQLLPIVSTLAALGQNITIGEDAEIIAANGRSGQANIVGFGDPSPRKITENGVVVWTIQLGAPCPEFKAEADIVYQVAFEKVGEGSFIPVIPLLTGMLQGTIHTITVFDGEF